MIRSTVTLLYGGRSYTFAEDADKVMKGKLGCDCTKSLLIRDYCDHDFPALQCGQKIQVLSLQDLTADATVRSNVATRG
jgi:hypothetical protein